MYVANVMGEPKRIVVANGGFSGLIIRFSERSFIVKTLTYMLFDTPYNICFEKTMYLDEDYNPAIRMFLVENEQITEPFGNLSVNLGHIPKEYKKDGKIAVFLDTNNLPDLPDFIKSNNLGENTGYIRQSGYCLYPLYLLDEDIIKLYTIH